jgi:hypothetical protein
MPINVPGLFVYHVLKRNSVCVANFIDNDANKHGTIYDGTRIISPIDAYRENPNASIILCELVYEKDMIRQLKELGFNHFIKCSEIIENEASLDALQDIKKDDLYNLPAIADKLSDAAAKIGAVAIPEKYRGDDALIISHFIISLTQRCTLKCRDCASLMQYYEAPTDTDINRILKSIDAVMPHVDYIPKMSLVGGEPLIYKDLPEVIIHLRQYDKIGVISVATNGTQLPSRELMTAMSESGSYCRMQISNYGELSRYYNDLPKILDEAGVAYFFVNDPEWQDCCKIIDGKERTDSDIQEMYTRCIYKCGNTILGDKLYLCNFLAHGTKLEAIPEDTANFIDLDDPNLSKAKIKKYLEQFLAFPGCRNCSGSYGYDANKVPIAAQAKVCLPYIKINAFTKEKV